MVISKASTVREYLDEIPPDQRQEIERVRSVVRKRLPKGYVEGMGFGMITWAIPLSRYPDTYNGEPLSYAALAAQKNSNSLYLMGAYSDPAERKRLEKGFQDAGLKMDMGKSCLRFKTADALPLDAIGDLISRTPPERLIELYEKWRGKPAPKAAPAKKAAKKRTKKAPRKKK